MPEELTTQTFETEILESQDKVLVLFHAPWARPSVDMLGRLAQIEGLRTASVDVDAHPDLARAADVRAVPTLSVFQGGRQLGFKVGLVSALQAYGWAAGL